MTKHSEGKISKDSPDGGKKNIDPDISRKKKERSEWKSKNRVEAAAETRPANKLEWTIANQASCY